MGDQLLTNSVIELKDKSNFIKSILSQGGYDNQLLITRYLRVQVAGTAVYSLHKTSTRAVHIFLWFMNKFTLWNSLHLSPEGLLLR